MWTWISGESWGRTVVEVAVGRVHEREQVLASVLTKGDKTGGGLALECRFLGRLGADGKVLAVFTHCGGFGGLGERERGKGRRRVLLNVKLSGKVKEGPTLI